MWRSLVAHSLWERRVAGSNPVIPTESAGETCWTYGPAWPRPPDPNGNPTETPPTRPRSGVPARGGRAAKRINDRVILLGRRRRAAAGHREGEPATESDEGIANQAHAYWTRQPTARFPTQLDRSVTTSSVLSPTTRWSSRFATIRRAPFSVVCGPDQLRSGRVASRAVVAQFTRRVGDTECAASIPS